MRDFNTPIDTRSSDEIGQLAKTFKAMIENIKTITATKDELNQEINARLQATLKNCYFAQLLR